MRSHFRGYLLVLSVLVVLLAAAGGAREYVSLIGQFYLSYPDNWEQVDYKEVNRALREMQAGQSMLDYDAVVAPAGQSPFHSGPYAIVTVDTSGEFSQKRIDSVINELSRMFHKDAKYFPIGDYMANLQAETPSYDADAKIISVLNTITQQGESFKKNLILFKFYERGVVTLYCYTPDSLYDQTVNTFIEMARSISTDNVMAHLPQEEVRVADLEDRELGGESNSGFSWLLAAVLVIAGILLLLLAVRLMKRQSTQS